MKGTLYTLLGGLSLLVIGSQGFASDVTLDESVQELNTSNQEITTEHENAVPISEPIQTEDTDSTHKQQVIDRAHEHGLTMYSSRNNALTDQYLTREQAAKVLTEFTKLYDPNRPTTLMICRYDDIDDSSEDLQQYISNVCNFRFMDLEGESFRPYDAVSQEELKSMLRNIMSEDDQKLVDHVIRNKALLPSLERGVVFEYLYELYNLTQENN